MYDVFTFIMDMLYIGHLKDGTCFVVFCRGFMLINIINIMWGRFQSQRPLKVGQLSNFTGQFILLLFKLTALLGPILLTGINFNPAKDK